MHRLGIVGHCALDLEAARFVSVESSALLAEALARSGSVVAVSALAEGADTLFAEAALAAKVPLDVVCPFAGYERDFATARSRSRYRSLAAAARTETHLRFRARSTRAYEAAMSWVVRNCDLLVAAWDGQPGRGRGGTAHTVAHAIAIGRPVVQIDVKQRVVRHVRRA